MAAMLAPLLISGLMGVPGLISGIMGAVESGKRMGGRRYDTIVFSRTFDILDFRNVKIISLYKNFLREYLKLWRENYIELVFKTEPK